MTARVEEIAGTIAEIAERATNVERDMLEIRASPSRPPRRPRRCRPPRSRRGVDEQIAASAQTLAATAGELTDLVGAFTLARV